MIKLRAKDSKNTFLKILFSLIFTLGFYSDAYSLSCGAPINWHTFNHKKLEEGKYHKLTQNEESIIIKLKGYVYYINRNHYNLVTDCTPEHIVRPIFFNDKYQYIELSNSGMRKLNIEDKIRDCIGKQVQFNKPNKIPIQRVEDPEISDKDDVKILEGDIVTKFLNSENLYIHPQNIKTCEAVLEGRVMSISHPVTELKRIDLATVILDVTSIESINRVE